MAGFLNAPRRRGPFGGFRLNTPMKSGGMPAPAGTVGSMPGPTSWGGSNGGINFSGSGYGAPPAMRAGGSFDHRFTDGTPGQPQIPAGVSTAMNPSGVAQAAPMAFEDGGAVDDDETGAIPDDQSPSDVEPDEGAPKTGNDILDSDNAGDTMTRNINAALAKVDAAFQQGRQRFGLTDNFRRSDNIEDSRNEQMGVADMLKARQQAIAASRAAKQNFENTGQDQAVLPINKLWDQPVLAIPGTLQDQAGLNDVGERYEDGGAIADPELSDTGDVDGAQASPVDDFTTGSIPQLAAYVQGEGAAPPDAVQSYLQKYRHLPPEQATVQALADASDEQPIVVGQELPAAYSGGIDSTSLLQGYRQHYDHGRAYAYAAANGNAQKPANLQDSVKAANDAFPYVPDGERVHFSVGRNGNIDVSVGGPNGEQRANTTLTPEQYKAYLAQADFDNVYERTPSLMLQQVLSQDMQKAGITTGPNPSVQADLGGNEFMAGSAGVQEQTQPGQQPAGKKQAIPGRTDEEGNPLTPEHHPGYNMYQNARGTYYVPEDLDARSHALTGGWLSREGERQQWLNEQLQQGIKNEIDMTKARNPLGVQQLRNEGQLARTKYASDLKAGWEDRRTQASIINNLDKIRAQHANEQARNAANIARSMLLGGERPEDVPEAVKKMTGIDMSRLLNLEGRTPQSPNAENSRTPPPTAQQQFGGPNTQVKSGAPQTMFYNGKLYYKTPTGWSPQQQ